MMQRPDFLSPNAIDSGDVPPTRPSRRVSSSEIDGEVVRETATRLLQESSSSFSRGRQSINIDRTSHLENNGMRGLLDDDEESNDTPYSSSLPSVEEARMYAGLVLSAQSARDLSPESAERSHGNLTPLVKEKVKINRGVPLATPPYILERQKLFRSRALCAFISVFIIATLIGLSVRVSQLSQNQAAPSDDTSNISKTQARSPRLGDTITFLTRYSISNRDNIDDETSPQFLAALWISDLDKLAYAIPDSHLSPDYSEFVQRYVLAVFYFSTGGNNWVEPQLFMKEEHVCAWFTRQNLDDGETLAIGITCNSNGDVRDMLMPRNNLVGTFPDELAHLEALEFIDFHRNEIEGTIPKEFSRLTLMTFFDIRNNRLQGTIPDWLGDNWINLEVLTLAENQMNGPLPTSIQKLSNLKTLSLAHNLFESSLEYISGLQNLEYLYLQKNHFTGSLDDTFLEGLSSLVQMDLSSNELTSSHLPSHLFSFPNLKVLHLGDNSLIGKLPDPFGKNTRLEFLSLSDNILTGSIPDSISELSSLKHLDLTDNQITGNIPVSLISMTSINYLFLSENYFDPGPIPDFLSAMTQLRELSLSLTRRTGTLPGKWLASLPNLVLLDFSFNYLNGTLPSVLWEHPQLHFLLLSRNQFSGTLPSGITDTQLQLLALDKNNITGDFSEVCTLNAVNVFTDCGEIICSCCTCCEDENPKCNNDLLYTNADFSWDYDYQRNYYAFSPLILINSTIEP